MTGAALLLAATAVGVLGVFVLAVPPERVVVLTFRNAPGPRRASMDLGRALAALVVLGVVAAVSGWVLPAVVVAGAVWWATGLWSERERRSSDGLARLEALAGWIEHLRDVLVAGDQPIGAVGATVATCPPVIRPQVRRLAAGLANGDPQRALRRFADELDDPVGDLVAAGLGIAVRRGARTTGVLGALAEHARAQCERRRVVEAERAPTHREVQVVTAIMATLVAALFVFARTDYLAAYDRPTGQLVLATALAGYVGLLVRVRRLARFPRPARFVTGAAS